MQFLPPWTANYSILPPRTSLLNARGTWSWLRTLYCTNSPYESAEIAPLLPPSLRRQTCVQSVAYARSRYDPPRLLPAPVPLPGNPSRTRPDLGRWSESASGRLRTSDVHPQP